MLNISRTDALSFARVQYQLLAKRAVDAAHSEAERKSMRRLVRLWDDRLARLSALGATVVVDDDALRVLLDLAGTVAGDVAADDLVDWLDAFPDTVAGLFPGALTYRIEATAAPAVPATTGNRQPSLALAA
ncbi:MAG: hypothetical protein ABSD62_12670 [Candidatus Limnocylindrales bacterium]|jgi:hypothetical protein